MKRMSQILYSLALLTLLILSSCGKDNSTSVAGSSSNTLSGAQCSCNTSEMPVCGINPSGNTVSYLNMCAANCFGATNTVQGHCVCSESLVCMSDGSTKTECNAQAAIRNNHSLTIVKFYGCNSKPPASL